MYLSSILSFIFMKGLLKMKNEITIELIAQTAGEIADKIGLEKLSLKEVAEKLGIRSPSLIFHVKNLNGLKRLLGQYTTRILASELLRIGFGKSGFDAVAAVGNAVIHFAVEHPGMYESVQWMIVDYISDNNKELDYTAFKQVTDLFYGVFKDMRLSDIEISHIIRGLRSLTHGFATIAGHKGFGYSSDAKESFEYCLSLFLDGIRCRLDEGCKAERRFSK
jgi:hypothetical protein